MHKHKNTFRLEESKRKFDGHSAVWDVTFVIFSVIPKFFKSLQVLSYGTNQITNKEEYELSTTRCTALVLPVINAIKVANVVTYSSPPQGQLYLVQISHGTPAFSDQAFLGHIQVKKVKGVVNGFDLPNLEKR